MVFVHLDLKWLKEGSLIWVHSVAIKATKVHKQMKQQMTNEPQHEISNNVVCVTSKASDQPAHMRCLIRAFASRLNII